MKSRPLTWIIATVLFAALPFTVRLTAQDQEGDRQHQHHHYKLIDIGTFGGPSSYFNSLDLTDVFMFSTAFYNIAQVRNRRGVFVGFALGQIPTLHFAMCPTALLLTPFNGTTEPRRT